MIFWIGLVILVALLWRYRKNPWLLLFGGLGALLWLSIFLMTSAAEPKPLPASEPAMQTTASTKGFVASWGWETWLLVGGLAGGLGGACLWLAFTVLRLKFQQRRKRSNNKGWAPGPNAGWRRLDEDEPEPREQELALAVYQEFQITIREIMRSLVSAASAQQSQPQSQPQDGDEDEAFRRYFQPYSYPVSPTSTRESTEISAPEWW